MAKRPLPLKVSSSKKSPATSLPPKPPPAKTARSPSASPKQSPLHTTASSKSASDAHYEVGYGRPPRATQFQKGQSGNPNGRPKGRRNLASTLCAVLNELVTVHENGRRVRITKFEAACKQLVNKAAAGDGPAIHLLLQLFPTLDALLSESNPAPIDREADQLLVQGLITRLRAYTPEDTTTQENLS